MIEDATQHTTPFASTRWHAYISHTLPLPIAVGMITASTNARACRRRNLSPGRASVDNEAR